ncbi:MAG: hypothetical protein ACOYL6_13950 [Bacteriovoracaceae bacterium]
MLFRTYSRFLTMVLSVCIITTTTPVVASQPELDLGIDQEELSDHLDLAENQLEQVENHKASKIDIKMFEKNLGRTLDQMQKRTEKKIDHANDKKVEQQYNRLKEVYLSSSDEGMKNKIFDIDKKDISTREKLKELNSDNFKNNVKEHMVAQVKEAGSVRAYIKEVRMALKEQRKIYKENHKQDEASLKMKTNEIQKEGTRLPAQSGQASGISLGSLLLITGIILVVLGPAVVGATWVTVGWVFIAVFGIVPLAIILVILIIALVAVIVGENKSSGKDGEFKPWNPSLIPPMTT